MLLLTQIPALVQLGTCLGGVNGIIQYHILSYVDNQKHCTGFDGLRILWEGSKENCINGLGRWADGYKVFTATTSSFLLSGIRPGVNVWIIVIGVLVVIALWTYFGLNLRERKWLDQKTTLGHSFLAMGLSVWFYILSSL